jgi:hypothetical protein
VCVCVCVCLRARRPLKDHLSISACLPRGIAVAHRPHSQFGMVIFLARSERRRRRAQCGARAAFLGRNGARVKDKRRERSYTSSRRAIIAGSNDASRAITAAREEEKRSLFPARAPL